MAKPDPKDDRIAELELGLESAQQKLAAAQNDAQSVGALKGEIEKLTETVTARDREIKTLKSQVADFQRTSGDSPKATIAGLPENAAQLKVSVTMVNAINGTRVEATAGDVLVVAPNQAALDDVQRKVGRASRCHPVTKEALDSARKAGRVH
jgi:predicted RNase H-like nuclease (RuvC/YqgF family)